MPTPQGGDAIRMTVLAGHQICAAGRADAVDAKCVLHQDTFGRQTIDIGRRIQHGQSATAGTDGMDRVVVRHDEQDVWLTNRFFGCSCAAET
jgi:hypothetical protein